MRSNHRAELLGVVRSLSSLEELGTPILRVLDKVYGSRSETPQKLFVPFGSRGTFPIVKALEYVTSENGPRPDLQLRMIPHIFSLENLMEVVRDYDLHPHQIKEETERIYEDIALEMRRKIAGSCESGSIVTDWDEVNSATNLVERVRLYNLMAFSDLVDFAVVSFIGDAGRNIGRSRKKQFVDLRDRGPQDYKYMNVMAVDPISWLDDEEFYARIGMGYPRIAAPTTNLVRMLFKGRDLGDFYLNFLRNYSRRVDRALGGDGDNLMYKVVKKGDATVDLDNPEFVLNASLDAYIETIQLMALTGRVKSVDYKPLDGRFKIDVEEGCVRKVGKRNDPIVLSMNGLQPDYPLGFQGYRHPFVLICDPKNESLRLIDNLMKTYFREFSEE
tara:strand:- start:751 stop:1914 length:1164 start_codon:yes stop_codon:yes gene_type:complete